MALERVALKRAELKSGGSYFLAPKKNQKFIKTGCHMLDMALGGGWAQHRVTNIVGDTAAGKTYLCIEACASFAKQYPSGLIFYRETEEAFDQLYAQALGFPLERVDFGDNPLETVEDLYEDLERVVAKVTARKRPVPILYIVDSLDALSDRGELARPIDKGSFGAEKAKLMSELFRRVNGCMARADMTFIVVSQLRDRIGPGYGSKHRRSGGNALDFYSSQIVWLARLGMDMKQVRGIKRPISMSIGARIKKNKAGMSYRDANFKLYFGIGIDDFGACMSWLKTVSRDKLVYGDMKPEVYNQWMNTCGENDYLEQMDRVHEIVEREWYAMEGEFIPTTIRRFSR